MIAHQSHNTDNRQRFSCGFLEEYYFNFLLKEGNQVLLEALFWVEINYPKYAPPLQEPEHDVQRPLQVPLQEYLQISHWQDPSHVPWQVPEQL